MHCLITAGPTYEKLDQVRRLTNFSTGRLGTELAAYLARHGQEVTLLRGEQATWHGGFTGGTLEHFGTTMDLREKFQAHARGSVGAIFHAAAVSDFTFGKIWVRSPEGALSEASSGKITTREGTLLAELVPTPKIISELRSWYPQALLVGWKYEVEGTREDVLARARRQMAECRTDACVANGAAYGKGFGLLRGDGTLQQLDNSAELFSGLLGLLD